MEPRYSVKLSLLVEEFGASVIKYTVRAWCRAEDYWTVFFDLQRDVRHAFDKTGSRSPSRAV